MAKIPSIYREIAVVYNPEKERARQEWRRIQKWLQARRIAVTAAPRVTDEMRRADFIIALGGDGTVLRVARAVVGWNVPVFGVNVGRLGFLAATDGEATYRTLARVLAGEGRIENRSVLSVTAYMKKKKAGPFFALNECAVRTGATGRVLTLSAIVQDQLLATYRGDGLIISTPTGSTAYNLAASGPIVHPEVDVLLLCPICPHSLSQRPLVIPTKESIDIVIEEPAVPAVLSLDGQLNYNLVPGDRVVVQRASQRVPLLMDPSRTFYHVLQSKLKWGGA